MADKLTVDQVHDLLDVLRADASIDSKVQLVTAAKSSIKQHNVPDNAVPVLFEALRTASVSQHAALVNAGFTSLNHLLTRLSRQEPKLLAKEAARTLPVIIDKLGDQKDKYRTLAQQALVTLYRAAPMDVERSVRNTAMSGKNPRAKESAMQWLLQMHQEQGLPFRGYVPGLMDLLEDADGMVRDAAKLTVIELFRNAPNAAKTDLKKQLKNFKVRPAIEQAIVKELAPTSAASSSAPTAADADPYPRPASSRTLRPTPSTSNLAASVSSLSAGERPVTPSPDSVGRAEQVEPLYVNTQREIDDMFREIPVWFEGKETEQNWLKREQSVTRLRRLIAGNGLDFQDAFLAGVRALLDGIIKAMTSLRTSLCKEGCSLIQDLAHACGPAIDPMVEILLQTLIKLSAGTKKISSQLANNSVDAIVAKATYSTRILQHIWGACQDKNVQPRTYASGWLKTVLHREAHHKERIEHSGGLDLVEKCIKKGLVDPNPGVRERMRATYWVFAGIWPARAEAIMNGLDGTAQRLLQNDANNPNSPKRAGASVAPSAPAAARPASSLSKSTTSASKPSLRETMLAKKREKESLAARNLPVRPGSAMAHFSPVRTASNASSSSTASSSNTGTLFGRQRADGEGGGGGGGGGGGAAGGLSVAPVRPAKRRPELHARPATAGPYSVRSHDHASLEQSSPPDTFRTSKAGTASKALAATPKRTAPRGRPGHQATASDSHLVTPSRVTGAAAANGASKPASSRPVAGGTAGASSRGSPPKSRPGARAGAAAAAAPREQPQQPQHPQPRQQQQERQELQERQQQERQELQERQQQEWQQEQERQQERQQEQPRATTPTTPSPMQPVRARGGGAAAVAVAVVDVDDDDSNVVGGRIVSPPLKVYEDPSDGEEAAAATTPTAAAAVFAPTALEDRPVNEDAGRLLALGSGEGAVAEMLGGPVGGGAAGPGGGAVVVVLDGGVAAPPGDGAPPEKAKQNARLLDSGIAKVQAQALDVHGFRKLQGIIREAGGEEAALSTTATTTTTAAGPQLLTDERFDALLRGLFAYLESRVTSVAPEKVPDVKAQILATIKLLLKKWRGRFQPHVSRGLEALLAARAGYDARTHMVAGLELLADELVLLGDAAEIAVVLTGALDGGPGEEKGSGTGSGSRSAAAASPHALSMGLHVLKELVEARPAFQPSEAELGRLAGLAQRCLESSESGVRMDAVQLCVALHARVGDGRFWDVLRGVQDDPKSLITYYIVKRQREGGAVR